MRKWKAYWKAGFRPSLAADEVDVSDAAMLVLQFLGIVFAATFGVLCWVFPWGLSDVPSIVGTVMQTVGLLCMIGAGLYALWASAWFGAGFGSAAGWLHLVALGACFYVIHTLVLRYWGF